jgi:hypothetical protein
MKGFLRDQLVVVPEDNARQGFINADFIALRDALPELLRNARFLIRIIRVSAYIHTIIRLCMQQSYVSAPLFRGRLDVCLPSISVFAQNEDAKIEIPVGFSFVNVHPDLTPITSFNVLGGGGGLVYNFSPSKPRGFSRRDTIWGTRHVVRSPVAG